MASACAMMVEVDASGLTQDICAASKMSFTALREFTGSLGMLINFSELSTSAIFSLHITAISGNVEASNSNGKSIKSR